MIATSLIAGVSGNVAAPAASMVLAAGVNALQGLGAQQIRELAPHLGGEGSPAHIALHAVLACAGGAAQGGSCTAGAAGASASVVFNHLVNKLNDTSIEELSPSEPNSVDWTRTLDSDNSFFLGDAQGSARDRTGALSNAFEI
ncbi:hypothetical protein [Bordetella sp. LUAb4]|uniref:hypothetical protein n=1 Tax=Bordetella sp. LUAb4 TaxID=2843195 RepID=UPI001E336EC6|nr:hypothetical protein [Bordetella sp. LUAb4]